MKVTAPEVVVLDVGHGNSTLVLDENWAVLVDVRQGGVVDDALRHFDVTTLDEVIVSHSDTDHCDGLSTLVLGDPCGVSRLHLKADPFKATQTWRDLVVALREPEASGVVINTGLAIGSRLQSPSGRVEIEVVAPTGAEILSAPHPELARGLNTNGLSTVLRVLIDGDPEVLLPGDLDSSGLRRLIASGREAQARTLVFPHHGGTPGSSRVEEFADDVIKLVQPEHVIFSVARNDGRFPRQEVVETIVRARPATRVSCTQLSEVCAPRSKGTDGPHLTELPANGRVGNCCSGSLHLSYSPAVTLPVHSRHEDFKSSSAPNAMCRP